MLLVVGEPVKRWTCDYNTCQALCCRQNRELTLKDIEKIAKATGMKKEDSVSNRALKGRIPFWTIDQIGSRITSRTKNTKNDTF